jgi:hypothetical protein
MYSFENQQTRDHCGTNLFSVTQQSNAGLERLDVEVSRSHTHIHTHTHTHTWQDSSARVIGPVAEAATYTTDKTHKRRTSRFSAEFEPAIPKIKPLQTYALDRTATGIGLWNLYTN